MKSSIGAVFNVKHSICEVILGLPPLHIQNKVNQIKHYLKINLNDVPEDPLKMFIKDHMEINSRNPAELKHALKHVYRFLQWKHREQQWQFTEEDQEIINQRDFSQFHCLSKSACKYTKMLMKKYTEVLWSESLQNEFINEGHSTIPKPSCSPLPLDRCLSRKSEVMVMQMLYEQNLLNSFLYKIQRPEVTSSLCHCEKAEQTSYHVILQCEKVDPGLRSQAEHHLGLAEGTPHTQNSITLLNASREVKFIQDLTRIVELQKDFLRDKIELNDNV